MEKFNKVFYVLLFVAFLCMSFVDSVSSYASPMALVAGFVFAQTLGNPFHHHMGKLTSKVLKISVVGLGFGMNIHSALAVGKEGFWLTVCSITIVLVLGYVFGRMLHLQRKMSHLVASGTAICGGSAIAAVAPAVKADDNQMSMALAVVFLLNSIALILFPILGHLIGMDQHQFGTWCAIAIHDTSSVVGAAAAYGEESLMVATTVKLARALWIIPVSILSALLFRSGSKKVSIPWFIFFFVAAMLLSSYVPAVNAVSKPMFAASKALLVGTLFMIGSNLSLEKMKAVGIKPLLLGIMLWIVVSIFSIVWIMCL